VIPFPLHTHPLLGIAGIRHGWTDGTGPDFRTDPTGEDHARSASALLAAAGLPRGAWARQVHGGTVLRVDAPGPAGEADALWTDTPGLGVIGRSADCPLVLLVGSRSDGRPVWGFAHASWRSTLAGISLSLARALVAEGTAAPSLRAVICPSAGPCCYEVGPEVREAFRGAFGTAADPWFLPGPDRPRLDLWRAVADQLVAAGVEPGRVRPTGICTICGSGYPSDRREGERAGRFAAVVGAVESGK